MSFIRAGSTLSHNENGRITFSVETHIVFDLFHSASSLCSPFVAPYVAFPFAITSCGKSVRGQHRTIRNLSFASIRINPTGMMTDNDNELQRNFSIIFNRTPCVLLYTIHFVCVAWPDTDAHIGKNKVKTIEWSKRISFDQK